MTAIGVKTTTSLACVKARLSAFVDSVGNTHERVVITRKGRPAAVLISTQDLESFEETITILSDPQTMMEIADGNRAIAGGNFAGRFGDYRLMNPSPLELQHEARFTPLIRCALESARPESVATAALEFITGLNSECITDIFRNRYWSFA